MVPSTRLPSATLSIRSVRARRAPGLNRITLKPFGVAGIRRRERLTFAARCMTVHPGKLKSFYQALHRWLFIQEMLTLNRSNL